jgi:hypothetical protein
VVLFSFYGVFSQFFQGILPIHEWRKTDSLSIALNYANGAPFLEPQTQWISAFGNRNAAAEFPIIYYMLGKLWAIFGHYEWISKALSLSLLFISVSLFSEVLEFLFKSKSKALFFVFILASSPVLIFYSDSILPNVYAFSFLCLGSFGVYKFLQTKFVFWLGFLTLFFALAVLLKITALIAILTFGGAWFFYCVFTKRAWFKKHAFYWLAFTLSFVLILLVVFLWYRYAIRYNAKMNSDLFSTTVRPIWEVDAETRRTIWEQFWKHMLPSLYHPSMLLLAVLFFLFAAVKKWIDPFVYYLITVGCLGLFAYFILWFWVFDVHDYYLIEMLFFPLILFYVMIKHSEKLLLKQKSFRIVFIAFLSITFFQAISYAHWSLGKENLITKNTPFVSQYVKGNWGYFHFYHREHLGQLQSSAKELQQIIPKNDTILCLSDPSPNIQLYTLKRIGYTQYSFHEPFHDETDQIIQFIRKGVNFALIIHEPNWEPNKDWEPFLNKPIYHKGNTYLYDLRQLRKKYSTTKQI